MFMLHTYLQKLAFNLFTVYIDVLIPRISFTPIIFCLKDGISPAKHCRDIPNTKSLKNNRNPKRDFTSSYFFIVSTKVLREY
jgi:hypothetical protein